MERVIRFLPYLIIAILILMLFRNCQHSKTIDRLYVNAQDSLSVTVNKLGQQTGRVSLLEAENDRDFLNMKSTDSTVKALQGIVRAYKGKLYNATVLTNRTRDTGSSQTFVVRVDTIVHDSVSYIYPTYKTDWSEKWSQGSIVASRDSIFRDIRVINDFEITQGVERLGLFKGSQTVVTVKNLNPNTVTQELRTFRTKDDKRLSVGVQLGVGVMATGGVGIYGGIGLNYRIMRLRLK
jgi:hypothetical protein